MTRSRLPPFDARRTDEPSRTVAARLASVRQSAFVGRHSEQELWRDAVRAHEPPFTLLWLHGPGGIGKTTLLARFAEIAAESGRPVVKINAQDLSPGQSLWSFVEERRRAWAAARPAGTDVEAALVPDDGTVILLDTAELLGPDERWLRDTFLPSLPESCLVALASRQAPDSEWLADPGWAHLARRMPLRNLSHSDAEALLAARGLRPEDRPPVLAATHGHPLALVLWADVARQAGGHLVPSLEDSPDIVRTLVQRFVRQVPSERHEQALCIAAHARVTNTALLRELVGEPWREAYEWLAGLSFVEAASEGIVLHELAAQVIDRDLRQRDPERYQRLHLDLRRRAYDRLRATSGALQLRWAMDFSWLHRFSPLMGTLVDWARALRLSAAMPDPSEREQIASAAELYDGPLLRASLEYWLLARPEAFVVLHETPGRAVGTIVTLELRIEECGEASERCPFTRAALELARRIAPLRPGESILLQWTIDFAGPMRYPSPLVLHNCAHSCVAWYGSPHLAFSFYFVPPMAASVPSQIRPGHSHADDYFDLCRAFGHQVLPGCPEGSDHCAVWRDWRVERVESFVDRMGCLELFGVPAPAASDAPPLLVLAEDSFRDGVRLALKHFRDLHALARSPLCRTRLVCAVLERQGNEATDAAASPALALRWAVSRAFDDLRTNTRDPQLAAAIEHTYIEPAPSQDIAAELVGLPFSTYRRRLRVAVGMVADFLWQRELGGWS